MNGIRALLDFPAASLAFAEPSAVIEAASPDEVRPALRRVEEAAHAGAYAVGFVAYEAAPAFDVALVTRPHEGPAPLLWFGIFDAPVARAATEPSPGTTTATADPADASAATALDWRTDTTRAAYGTTIAHIRESIAAGDVYQVNHTLRFHAPCARAAATLYDLLAAPRHGRYHALIETPRWSIVSASPELFLDYDDGVLTTRPMKGTHRRGRWSGEDRAHAAALATSAKDRAENLMIVDLLRNDLGRIAATGTVHVPRMFEVETYPTVHQLTSTITAQPRDGIRLDDIFTATFPCGSVTGAPKIAAMHAIAGLEQSPRGAYCGAIGIIRPDGTFTFNVAIRTLLLDHSAGTAVYGAGGGITWDSTATGEYDELISKAALLSDSLPPFELIETLRLEDGVLMRLELHLERLRESAAYWSFDERTCDHARAALLDAAARAPSGSWRVRLTANAAGDVAISRTPLADGYSPCSMLHPHDPAADDDADTGQPAVRLAITPVSRNDRLLFHKTTSRAVYDSHRAGNEDVHDVLLWNEQGEVTEFTTGNVVAWIDGALRTPPRESGLLAGTLRQELLRAGVVVERVIGIDEIRRAPVVWHINSVRGCVRVAVDGRDPPLRQPITPGISIAP